MKRIAVLTTLFMLALVSTSLGQITLKGRVIDAKSGKALIGANVRLIGTSIGIATDADRFLKISNGIIVVHDREDSTMSDITATPVHVVRMGLECHIFAGIFLHLLLAFQITDQEGSYRDLIFVEKRYTQI